MSNIHFTLPALNRTIALDVSGALLQQAPETMLDVSATAFYNFKVGYMHNIFRYYTDSIDITDISNGEDVRYYVFMNNWPLDASLNPAHALMSAAGGHILPTDATTPNNKNLVKHDFTRYLAFKLFNTPHGVDLFSNEEAIKLDLSNKGRTIKSNIMSVLNAVSTTITTGTTIAVGQTDVSGNRFTTNLDSSNSNICRELMRQIASVAPSRFYDASYSDASGNFNLYRPVPLRPGDSINFKVTIVPANGQHTLTGRTGIENRVYKISLVMADSTNVVPVDGNATDLLDYIRNQ
jgi:hypothetical protein